MKKGRSEDKKEPQECPGEHEALISREVWDETQKYLVLNSRFPKGRQREPRYAQLKGIIRAGLSHDPETFHALGKDVLLLPVY